MGVDVDGVPPEVDAPLRRYESLEKQLAKIGQALLPRLPLLGAVLNSRGAFGAFGWAPVADDSAVTVPTVPLRPSGS